MIFDFTIITTLLTVLLDHVLVVVLDEQQDCALVLLLAEPAAPEEHLVLHLHGHLPVLPTFTCTSSVRMAPQCLQAVCSWLLVGAKAILEKSSLMELSF